MMRKDKTVLLSCCAPCSCAIIEKMAQNGDDFTVLFYNPNINPYEEYVKRLEENKRLCDIYGVKFVDLEYDNDRWSATVAGLENEPERGKRCSKCFNMRIKRAMEYAKDNGFNKVASVLGASRYKDLDQVNRSAADASKATGVEYIHVEARKGGMQERREILTKELNLYHQTYCGCKPR